MSDFKGILLRVVWAIGCFAIPRVLQTNPWIELAIGGLILGVSYYVSEKLMFEE